MGGIWNERTVKKPEDFHAALWAGSCGISEDFALGYATALYDIEAVDMAGLTAYVTASASGSFSHNLDFKANGRKGAAGYKYEDGAGCYVIESFPIGTENPDFEHPHEVYVGQSLHICNRVRNHLNGKGNGDVYADVREGKPVFVHLERCEETQMNDLERRLIDAFHATESYNSTRGGARRR